MRPVCTYTDFFVVCTGQNPRQTKAICDEVHAPAEAATSGLLPALRRRASARRPGSSPTTSTSSSTSSRPRRATFYRLEELWGDVPSLEAARRPDVFFPGDASVRSVLYPRTWSYRRIKRARSPSPRSCTRRSSSGSACSDLKRMVTVRPHLRPRPALCAGSVQVGADLSQCRGRQAVLQSPDGGGAIPTAVHGGRGRRNGALYCQELDRCFYIPMGASTGTTNYPFALPQQPGRGGELG